MTNKYNLIESFFIDQSDYISFLVKAKERTIANDDATCFATLTKEPDRYVYKLIWLKDGRYLGEYIKPFKASQENVDIFNKGCKAIAELLTIYLDTNDLSKVPMDTEPFGILNIT